MASSQPTPPVNYTPQSPAVSPRELVVAGIELLLASAIIVATNVFHLIPVSETPWLILLGWVSLRLRGLGWRSLGLRRPNSWIHTILIAVAAGVLLQVLSEFVIEPVVERLTGETADLSNFRSLVGNLPATLGMLGLVWTLAAFGEELSYRGYVLERAATLGGRSSTAYVVAMVIVSLLFGVGHFYQGMAGVISSTVSGLFFGALYLASSRNLWLPILAHGFSDTIGLALIYLGFVKNL